MKKTTNFQWSWVWDNTHNLQVVSWHGSSFIWPTSLSEKPWVCSRKNRRVPSNSGVQKVPANDISQKERVSPEKGLLWAELRFHRAQCMREIERRSRKCPGGLTGGKSLTESSKIPSKSMCFLWWASSESCDNVKKEARGSPEPDRGAVVSESKQRASGNRGAHSHLLTIAEQEQTLCTRHCSKHLHILAHLISTILRYRFSFYPHCTDEEIRHTFVQEDPLIRDRENIQPRKSDSRLCAMILYPVQLPNGGEGGQGSVCAYIKASPSLSSGEMEEASWRYKPSK